MTKDKNKSIKINKINRKGFIDQFKDHDTKITDEYLPDSLNQDLEMLRIALWGIWQAEVSFDNALPEVVSHFQDLSCKITKITEFAELCSYATGFEIPEDKGFRYIDVEALEDDTNNSEGSIDEALNDIEAIEGSNPEIAMSLYRQLINKIRPDRTS